MPVSDAGHAVQFLRNFRGDVGGGYLVRIAFGVFGLVVEEILLRNDLRDRETYSLPPATSIPQPISRPVTHSSIRISSPWANAASMAAGSSSGACTFVTPNDEPLALGFTNRGIPVPRRSCAGSTASPLAQEDLAGQVDTPCERAFGGDLVEGDDRRGHRARRIGNAHHVEVALQLAVLAGRAVNDDQRVVERFAHTVDGDREIILVHLPLAARRGPCGASRGRGGR